MAEPYQDTRTDGDIAWAERLGAMSHAVRDHRLECEKAERDRVLREFLELASGLELANADDADEPAKDFCRGVRSAGRRLSKLIAAMVTP